MQTRVVLTAILLALFGFSRPFRIASGLDVRTEDQLKISNIKSTLLLRNLSDAFGENASCVVALQSIGSFSEYSLLYSPVSA